MLHPFRTRRAAAVVAVLVNLLSLAPAFAQGAYPYAGGSMGAYVAPRNSNSGGSTSGYVAPRNSYQMAGPSMGSYGRFMMGNQYQTASPGLGDGDNDADDVSSPGATHYAIVFGDTLSRIARRFGVSIQAILAANPFIRNRNLIFAGQRLLIPAFGTGIATAQYAPPYSSATGSGSSAYQAPSAPERYAAPGPALPVPPAAMAPMPAPQATAIPGPTTVPAAQTLNIDLTAHNMSFDRRTITVPAGAHVVVHFANQDAMPHNFAVYVDSTAAQAIFQGQILMGPASTTYRFDAPARPGTYFFRCDVHPAQMNGQFVVQ